MSATMTAVQALQQVRNRVDEIKSSKTKKFPEAASPGDFFRQGDIYITLVESIPADATEIKPYAQLAPGETRGSRHTLTHLDVRMFKASGDSPLQGPLMKCDRAVTVEHPEHGHVELPPGCYNITYQRAYAEELRRVRD